MKIQLVHPPAYINENGLTALRPSLPLGLAYIAAGRGEDAECVLRLATRLAPGNWAALVGLEALRVAAERPDAARALLAEALAPGAADARAMAASFPALVALLPQ